MDSTEKLKTKNKSIMVLGTSSGVGKSITVTAICRMLRDGGEEPIPFKGQNMSNNAWVDEEGGEMAYCQALQAFACGIVPSSVMNPILLKPQGDSTSEVIHLGKSKGITSARNYYKHWYKPGWEVIKESLNKIFRGNENCRLIIEGAGSPVEMNLIHRDLTNLKIAKYLDANCILVTDIEKGGVFSQIVGTLELMQPEEKRLIKGIIINRFRGDLSLFDEGRKWIEKHTGVPILGILPSLEDNFPPEDSLDLLDKSTIKNHQALNVGIIKFPSISNFSDFDPLENEESINLSWIRGTHQLDKFDIVILPGSKQTIKDQIFLEKTGLVKNIRDYSQNKGNILGICGGLQMLGEYLEDPHSKEGFKECDNHFRKGIGLLPLRTKFSSKKYTKQINTESEWPCKAMINGFEIHNGLTEIITKNKRQFIKPIFKKDNLGWYLQNNDEGTIVGTYIHGIFENDLWRESYLNLIRDKKSLPKINKKIKSYNKKRNIIIDRLAKQFEKHINISLILN